MTDRWKAYALGPNGTNICTHPQFFARPPQKVLKGKTALTQRPGSYLITQQNLSVIPESWITSGRTTRAEALKTCDQ